MDVELSDEALAEYSQLEAEDPSTFDPLVDDLSMLSHLTLDDLDALAELVGLTYYQGPTGRVRYWAVVERGRPVIEFFDVDA